MRHGPRARPRGSRRASSPTTETAFPSAMGSHRSGPASPRHAPAASVRAPRAHRDHKSPREDVRGGSDGAPRSSSLPRRDRSAVFDLSLARAPSRGWRGVKMNPKTVAELERLRRQLRKDPAPPATVDTEEAIAA